MARPNIVVFIPDQLRADALGCFGNPVASTPHIDALAARGTRFEQAFGQHPFCTQSRVSFLTGLYPHVHGHRTLAQTIRPDQPDALGLLKEAGYHVAHAGMRGDTYAPGRTKESTSRFGWAVLPELFHSPNPYDQDHPRSRAFYHGRRADPPADRPGPVLDFDEACVRTAEAWLAEGLPEPWLLYVPLFFPHPPFEVEDPWYSQHDRADVPLPLPRPTGRAARFKEVVHERYGLGRLDEDDWREIVATYYGMVSRTDHHLGRVLEAVARTGAEDRTAVLFFPDHGEYLGDFGLIEKWVAGVDPCLVRNPLIVHVPDGPEGQVADDLVELVDVTPTLCELGEIDPPARQFGRSLVPLVRGRTGAGSDDAGGHGGDGRAGRGAGRGAGRNGRTAAFTEGGLALADAAATPPQPFPYDLKHGIEAELPVTAGKVVALRTAEWTYVHRVHEGPELYDRRTDPQETTNLADDPAHATTVADLRATLLDWLVETADVLGPAGPRFDADGALMPART
ncbi:MAG TPA: sulfatase-like hydrolase/transferase [Acidimicrobiales bacterium]